MICFLLILILLVVLFVFVIVPLFEYFLLGVGVIILLCIPALIKKLKEKE